MATESLPHVFVVDVSSVCSLVSHTRTACVTVLAHTLVCKHGGYEGRRRCQMEKQEGRRHDSGKSVTKTATPKSFQQQHDDGQYDDTLRKDTDLSICCIP